MIVQPHTAVFPSNQLRVSKEKFHGFRGEIYTYRNLLYSKVSKVEAMTWRLNNYFYFEKSSEDQKKVISLRLTENSDSNSSQKLFCLHLIFGKK